MGIEIVLHDPDFPSLRVASRQLLPKLGVLALGALAPNLIRSLAKPHAVNCLAHSATVS